ncbi:hypothetical protein Vafri_16987 [Volvox africanus]|uniref:Uncharacterized protein n=1 Tax=Volvox africanus TaxID=51714 RepID=A0A8J4BK12_9CHLO|nr:hypothetical protein Vafri_16987 [Volvox africanus]
MQASFGCQVPAVQIPACARWRTYTPPCAPSSSGRLHSRVIARAGKENKDNTSKHENKADFSALWALRVKNFFSSRRKYLQQAEQPIEDAEEKLAEAEIAREEEKLRRMREEVMEMNEAELRREEGPGDLRENIVASDIARARLDLSTSQLTKATLAVVQVREFLRALLMLPFSLSAAAFQSWQSLFNSQRYENFLMSEGERMWYWRNRMENERWFWEVLVWDRLLFRKYGVIMNMYGVRLGNSKRGVQRRCLRSSMLIWIWILYIWVAAELFSLEFVPPFAARTLVLSLWGLRTVSWDFAPEPWAGGGGK